MSFKEKLTKNNDAKETFKPYNTPIQIIPLTSKLRKCTIPNYIPHRTPRNTNKENWNKSYRKQLIEMFMICQNIINDELPNHKITSDNKQFNIFSHMIYNSSSKYISPYLDSY